MRWSCWAAGLTAVLAMLATSGFVGGEEILIGVEYALEGRAHVFAGLGIPAVKHLPELVAWGKMQPSSDAPIDFSKMDAFVREYHEAGFREIVLGLKSLSQWASKAPRKDLTPKPEYIALYENWIRSIVERYDADGREDMPGLKRPVRIFEIGVELSAYEPEPVADYLAMLEKAYRAAHAASDKVLIAHAAFLPTTAFLGMRRADRDTEAYRAAVQKKLDARLDDMRVVLTRPELFDLVNFHALGDPYEIEFTVGWIRQQTKRWPRPKPILISDTSPNGLIGWGPATTAEGHPARLGIIAPPGTEMDRPRLAAFFRKLVDGDEAALQWAHTFVAEDMVKKVVIAAEQDVMLINTSFTEDLPLLQTKLFMAGAGLSAWGGMVKLQRKPFRNEWTVQEYRPAFYAVRQLQAHLHGYNKVERINAGGDRICLYRFERQGRSLWVAWFEPEKLVLLGDPVPTRRAFLPIHASQVVIENMIHRHGQTEPERQTQTLNKAGGLPLELTPRPVFVLTDRDA